MPRRKIAGSKLVAISPRWAYVAPRLKSAGWALNARVAEPSKSAATRSGYLYRLRFSCCDPDNRFHRVAVAAHIRRDPGNRPCAVKQSRVSARRTDAANGSVD